MDVRASFSTLPVLTIDSAWNWDTILAGPERKTLASALAGVLPTRRWFGAKARQIRNLTILEAIPLASLARLLVVRVAFATGPDEVYQMPLAFMANGAEGAIAAAARWLVVEHRQGGVEGVLYDAVGDSKFCGELLAVFDEPMELIGSSGTIEIEQTVQYESLRGSRGLPLTPRVLQGEQSNSSIVFGDQLIMKLFRRVENGLNPDLEISKFLTSAGFKNTPALAGEIVYRQGSESWALAMLQAFVPNQGDAWRFTLDWLSHALTAYLTDTGRKPAPELPRQSPLHAAEKPLPAAVRKAFGEFLDSAAKLGERTAQMHRVLSSAPEQADFAPEPLSHADLQAYLLGCTDYARDTFALLREQLPRLMGAVADRAACVGAFEATALDAYASLAQTPLQVQKIRIHGDYHLGQVLAVDGDFLIIDFEGEPVRSIAERRQKQLAMRDVAGMLRSFHYASRTAASAAAQSCAGSPTLDAIDSWAASWHAWTCVAFLASYLQVAGRAGFVPAAREQTEKLLAVCLLEKAIYELRYELNNRPDWVYLPLSALEDLLK